MDYDKTSMAAAFEAGRGYSPNVLNHWLDIISRAVSRDTVSEILDLGCGTGRYSGALSACFDAHVIGVDPSERMLAEARKKGSGDVIFIRACGEDIPLPDCSVDMVFISMAFHHFADHKQVARECRRVLRSGGCVCVRAATLENVGTFPYVPFFPRSPAIMMADLQSKAFIETIFHEAGLKLAQYELVPSEEAQNWKVYAERLAHRADSILVQLSDAEFVEGLANLREFAANTPSDGPVMAPVDFFVFK